MIDPAIEISAFNHFVMSGGSYMAAEFLHLYFSFDHVCRLMIQLWSISSWYTLYITFFFFLKIWGNIDFKMHLILSFEKIVWFEGQNKQIAWKNNDKNNWYYQSCLLVVTAIVMYMYLLEAFLTDWK